MTDTTPTPIRYGRGLRPFDAEKHARWVSATAMGYVWPTPVYPIDRSGGVTDFGMGGNGPDSTLTVNGGRPMGDCGPNAVPKNADLSTAALLGEAPTPWSSDAIAALYFTYQAELAGISWRPPTDGSAWTPPDGLDNGVDLGDWLHWLFVRSLIDGFVRLDLSHMDAALQAGFAVVVGVTLTDNADAEFPGTWVVSPTEQPNPNDGHAILRLGSHAADGNKLYATWGGTQLATAEWDAACVQQAFAVFTVDQGRAVGFPVAETITAIDALGGTVIAAPPSPTPAPEPAPPTTPPPPVADSFVAELEHLAHEAISALVALVEKHGGRVTEWTGPREGDA